MSSAVVSTSAAQGRFFIFDADSAPGVPRDPERNGKSEKNLSPGIEEPGLGSPRKFPALADPRLARITPASHLVIRPAPEMVSSGIPAVDALTGGIPRGCLTEICGPASSGRTSLLLAALAAATHRGEYCAFIDASDALDPHSVAAAGIELDRLLWVRCGNESQRQNPPRGRREAEKKDFSHAAPSLLSRFVRKRTESNSQRILNSDQSEFHASERRLEQVLHATDLLLESGGFGLIVLDLAAVPSESARRIPLTTWFRFRRAIEHRPTILLVIEQMPIAGSCSSLLLQLGLARTQYPVLSAQPSHSQLLTGFQINVELIRSRLDRKPSRSVAFATKTAWAG